MKAQFIYSVAALATFPIVVNAQVDAENTGAITIQKDATSWSKESVNLAPGKYSFLSGTNAFGKDAVLSITGAGIKQVVNKKLAATDKIEADFEITATSKVTITVTAATARTADTSVASSKIQLNFSFTNVAQKLFVEYNKVTGALATAEYTGHESDAATYTSLYSRIMAIQGANYAFYVANSEGLQAIYEDQAVVTGLVLYSDIQDALAKVQGKEKTYQLGLLDGNDGLGGLNARYLKLNDKANGGDYDTSYITLALSGKKTAAKSARDAYENDATAEKLQAAKDALKAYGDELTKEEGVKTKNEAAKANLDDALKAVYEANGKTDFYHQSQVQIETQYEGARYDELKIELLQALLAYVSGPTSDYKTVADAIEASYQAKTADSKQSDLGVEILQFKQKLTVTISNFKAKKDVLAATYDTYDAEETAANALVKDAKDFLEDYAKDVTDAVAAFKTFIEANDMYATIDNLTDAAILEKTQPITAAKAEYTKQEGIYADYKALKDAVEGKTTSLNTVKTAIDADAKTAKKLAEEDFKPTTLWKSTIEGIAENIGKLAGYVEANKKNASVYKTKKTYIDSLQAIQISIDKLNTEALQATALYAGYAAKLKVAKDSLEVMNDKSKTPKVDFTLMGVWENQVTIDEAAKKRTPYKNFLHPVTGSIAANNADLVGKLVVMGNTGPLASFQGTVLDYLKSKGVVDAVKAVADGSALMTEIAANYEADENLFKQQVDIQICEGLKTNINNLAVVFEGKIANLQKRINDNEFGNVKGALLQTEINAITKKITDAKAVAAKAGATKDELTTAYNSIANLNDEGKDIKTAEAHAVEYAIAFNTYKTNYKNLVGEDTDASNVSTIAGLNKKITEQKAVIDGLTKLSAAQKSGLKDKVQAVQVVKKEGDPQKDVTYSLVAFDTILKNARDNEELSATKVSDYQGIIEELKTATDPVITQASRLNSLETDLAAIDFAAAKTAVKAQDPNPDGFYYLLLVGNTKAGQCTFDFNALKKTIEEDTDITDVEYPTYAGKIGTLKTFIEGLPQKAKDNLDAFKTAKKAYDFTPSATSNETPGALQRYAKAWADLLKCPSSELENQKAVIVTMKEALDQLRVDAETSYNNGDAKEKAYASKINNKIKEIEEKVAEYTNPVNYSAQVALDNLAMKNAIKDAHDAADAAYAKASSAVNTCKNFKSTELKDATEAAAAELKALLEYLEDYDKAVADIQGNADADYAATISPEFFDKDGEYKKQFEDIKAELEALTNALSEKVRELAATKVTASINSYSNAIAYSKGRVAKFSDTDKNLTEAQVNALFTAIDAMQKAIVDNNVENADITALDLALTMAEGDNGITASIATVEQDQAQTALKAIITKNTHSDLLTGQDKGKFESIVTKANSTVAADRKACVSNFASYKSDLNNLKTKADQIYADNLAMQATKDAIDEANNELNFVITYYQYLAAAYQVKAEVDQIAADLKAYDKDKVTVANAAAWKTEVEAISERIEAVYVDLYDYEVPVIEGLIAQAKEELLTYSKDDKADISAKVTAIEEELNDVKTRVAKPLSAPTHLSKKDALKTYLKNLESRINTEIKKLTDENQTNINAAIIQALNTQVTTLQNRITESLKLLNVGLSGNKRHSYSDVKGTKVYYYITDDITAEKEAIDDNITALNTYISVNENQIAAYEANAQAKIDDIAAAVTALEQSVTLEVEKQYNKFVATDNATIKKAKDDAQAKVTTAKAKIERLGLQLGYYGSTNKYTNKIANLNAQYADAEEIMADANAAAEATEVLKNKYKAYMDAQTAIDDALVGVAANCTEIEAQAKAAYIDAFIANLDAQIIADTWTGSSNYTNTDQAVLTQKRNALKQYVNSTLKTQAAGRNQAEDLIGGSKGVITTLNEGAEKFATDLAALKQALKDMSLVEDVKGHVSGNDEISSEDMEDLADIILNAEEGDADLSRCDINGDSQIDVTDLVWLRYFLVHGDWPNVAAGARGDMANDYINMQIVSTENNVTRIAINLDNETVFNHFQLNVQLPEGAKVVGQNLGERVEGANLLMAQNAGTVRLLAISTANNVFAGNSGAVVYIDIENLNGEVSIEKAIFTDTELTGHELTGNSTTGITQTITNALESAGKKIYNLGGKMMNGLKKGINIIRNADGSTTKVMK